MTELPRVIWLQIYGDHLATWSAEKINDSDVRYVIDKRDINRHLKKAKSVLDAADAMKAKEKK